MSTQTLLWTVFGVLVAGALTLDLGLFQRRSGAVSLRRAVFWTVGWISLALCFGAGVFFAKGSQSGLEYLQGYLVEYSLSVDNLFVFLVVFSYFAVPPPLQRRALLWGILGAVVMRGAFIGAGVWLIHQFDWVLAVFGVILILTGIKLLFQGQETIHPEKNPAVRLFKKYFRASDKFDGEKFFTRIGGKLVATPLFLVVLVIETTDVLFAVDSIPAVFAITQDPFIVYTSNIFAILGLRSLYFLLARIMGMFRFLRYGLVVILWFVGGKMLLEEWVKIPAAGSLSVIVGVLAVSIVLSLLLPASRQAVGSDARKK